MEESASFCHEILCGGLFPPDEHVGIFIRKVHVEELVFFNYDRPFNARTLLTQQKLNVI